MNDYFEKYNQSDIFNRNKNKQTINHFRTQNILNNSYEIYIPYQSYFFSPHKNYPTIYSNYNYNETNYPYDYYINNKLQNQKKKYNYNTYTLVNKSYENFNNKINNIQEYLGNNKSFNTENKRKMYNSFNKYTIGNNNNIFNTINNYNNYNLHTYNNYIILDSSSNLNNKFISTNNFSYNNFEFNSNSLDLGINTNSKKIRHLSKLTEPENPKADLNIIYGRQNKKKKKLINLNNLSIKTDLTKDSNNKKIIKISILNGNAYIARQKNNTNFRNNNNNFYISNPHRKIEKIDFSNIYNKDQPIEKKNYKIIKLDNRYSTINKEKPINKIRKIKTFNNSKIFTKFSNINKSQENVNCNLNKPPLKNNILNGSLNLNPNFKSNFFIENKINKSIKMTKKINHIKKMNIPLSSMKLNQKSNHNPKIQKILKKKINLNLNHKNLKSQNLINHNSKNLFKSYSPKKEKNLNKNIINGNVNEKKEKINYIIPVPNNNSLTISINTSTNKNNDLGIDKMKNYQKNNIKSVSVYKKDNLSNNFKTKKECELCHEMIFTYLYKVHKMIHPTPIFPYLFLGNFNHASNVKELKQLKINYILNVAHDCHNYNLPDDIEELHLMIKDSEDFPIIDYFEKGNEFIDKCKLMGGTCLVHCKLGVSRSTAFVIAYLIKTENLSADDAFAFVKKKRSSIKPNDGFMKQLHIYEKIIRGNK